MNKDDSKSFILKWSENFPYDRWWRIKHGVAFLSEEHKKISFVEQYLEYQEDMLFKQIETQLSNNKKDIDPYIPNKGDIFKKVSYDNYVEENKITPTTFEEDIKRFREDADGMKKRLSEALAKRNGKGQESKNNN